MPTYGSHRTGVGQVNPYDELGLTPDATPDEVKAAYRARAMKHHPDRGGDPDRMMSVQAAYGTLKDPEQRDRYDTTGGLEDTPAEERLMQLIRSAVDNGNWRIDIVEDMRLQLRGVMRSVINANDEHLREVEELSGRIGRVVGGPRMDWAIQSKVTHLETVIKANELEYSLIEEVLALLVDYSDTNPPPLAWGWD